MVSPLDLTNAAWTGSGQTVTLVGSPLAPDGSANTNQVQLTGPSGTYIQQYIDTTAYPGGGIFNLLLWFRLSFGSATLNIKITETAGGSSVRVNQNITPTGSWVFYPFQFVVGAGVAQLLFQITNLGTGSIVFYTWNPWIGNSLVGSTLHSTITGYTSPSSVTIADTIVTSFYDGATNNVALYQQVATRLASINLYSTAAAAAQDQLKASVLQSEPYFTRNQVIVSGQPVYLTSADPDVGEIFGGRLDVVTASNTPGIYSHIFVYDLTCVSWASIASRRIVTIDQNFTAQNAGDIFHDIIQQFLWAEGVSSSFVAGPSLDLTISAGTSVFDALDQIVSAAAQAVGIAYYWMSDPWLNFTFGIRSGTAAPWDVDDTTGSAGNVLAQVSAETSHDRYSNSVFMLASDGTEQQTLSAGITEREVVEGPGYRYFASLTSQFALADPALAAFINGYLQQYGQQLPVKIMAETCRGGLRTGMHQHIRLADIGVNGTFFITQITMYVKDTVTFWRYEAFAGAALGNWIATLVNLYNQGQLNPNILPGK